MTQKILEILIPTYLRPQAAIAAIDSVLAAADQRVAVACHSNCPDLELELAAKQRPALRYGSFPENRGAVANFRKMLEESRGDYVMFLSDEDRIDHKHLGSFVNFLSGKQYGFVLCNIVESSGAQYFSITSLQIEMLSAHDLLVLFTLHPTYLSGYCFRRDLLSEELISANFESDDSNVYPHLLLRNAIAGYESVGLFAGDIIIKGVEANFGGDSHSHVAQSAAVKHNHHQQYLNPRIYGQGARARQLYYLVPRLEMWLKGSSVFRRGYVNFYVLSAWLNITHDAHKHVDAMTDIPSLRATIGDYKSANKRMSGLIGSYNRILLMKSVVLRGMVIKVMWQLAKLVKLILFIRRFGFARTRAFVAGKGD
ncbi:glycosyltransferase [Curvibacter sp. HBC61]|uniref:Glycosyltransferase n=1 Tax=Curvibacter cyanobacteriorum TaxID=3026422 RepID=A0ABT5N066_9BURK|nr:glycosyltransferase [Curvibacter sp. HBC61]MDD0838911.1 glycosyltransferase [Curvibacter sp. HBC61]